MTTSRIENTGNIIFHCTRQNPDKFENGMPDVFQCSRLTRIELPCSGRVGTGDLLQALASGHELVVVISCGVESCVHGFGCREAKKAMDRARDVAKVAGVDASRLIFIEADDTDTKNKVE